MIAQQKNHFNGFSKLTRQQRFERLEQLGALSPEAIQLLHANQCPPIELAEKFIENVIGYFPIPLGIAVNFIIDAKSYVIPMAVEETSIIAAASKTAKWVCDRGEIYTETIGNVSIGQIQLAKVSNFKRFNQIIEEQKAKLINSANKDIAAGLVKRGGGVVDITVRQVKRCDDEDMAVLHVLVNTCDAMGANIINQICEFLRPAIEMMTQEQVTMCILSNLNDSKLTKAHIIVRDINPELGEKICEASLFAELDPYRAATGNKGVLNGMDPVLLATGNDWRAIEAGVHAYACRDGQYRSITSWHMDEGHLMGTLAAPIMVGIVGGVTKLHPVATMCLDMLNVESADELARIVAAVGLVQNLGAIRALISEGITAGHMKLHISNLSMCAGAQEHELPLLKQRLEQKLQETKHISLTHAIEILQEIRK